MARGLFRKTSFSRMVGAYRSQWKRFWMRLFTFGMYGRKGMGWLRDPKKACYNWWYHRTSISIPRLLGYKPSRASFICAMLIASFASILAAPVDATRAGVRAHKIKAKIKARAASSGTSSSSSSTPGSSYSTETKTRTNTSSTSPETTARAISTKNVPKPHTATASQKPKVAYKPPVRSVEAETPKPTNKNTPIIYKYESPNPVTSPEPILTEPDENTPKSKPKHEKDQYIRKRMIIAGSSYCDKAVLDKLTVGSYVELVAEPSNPYDKDAIMLMYEGEKIGYIAKQDNLTYVTCLRLNRKIYGVITDINSESYPTKYEYETWFDYDK